jgi:nifR3 family TIM-barrel protein
MGIMINETTSDIFAPIAIGTLRLRNNLIAAPMAGLSSLPYRMLAMEFGCALAISEMVSAEGTTRARERTRRYFANDAGPRPFGLQIFGSNPDSIARAVESLRDEPIDLIDINMGCPVHKVVKKGAGSGLMRNIDNATAIVRAVKAATALPVTAKIRAGWDEHSINCTEFAQALEAAGADAITVHPRTRAQGFRGKSDWSLITAVKKATGVPVIGNGDVATREDAVRMLRETGCDGVMIGRAAVGNPWIFKHLIDPAYAGPSTEERGAEAARHLSMLCALVGERIGVLNMRQILPWYGRGISGVKHFLKDAHAAKTREELLRVIDTFFGGRSPSIVV